METFRADFEKFQEMCETWIIEKITLYPFLRYTGIT